MFSVTTRGQWSNKMFPYSTAYTHLCLSEEDWWEYYIGAGEACVERCEGKLSLPEMFTHRDPCGRSTGGLESSEKTHGKERRDRIVPT